MIKFKEGDKVVDKKTKEVGIVKFDNDKDYPVCGFDDYFTIDGKYMKFSKNRRLYLKSEVELPKELL